MSPVRATILDIDNISYQYSVSAGVSPIHRFQTNLAPSTHVINQSLMKGSVKSYIYTCTCIAKIEGYTEMRIN